VNPVELPTLQPVPSLAAAPPVASISREHYEQLARQVRLLSWLSLGWMSIEGAVALTAGIVASSIALVGFGLDSVIEGVASLIIIWRFTGNRVFSHSAEQRAQKLVAVQFFLLAPYVGLESIKVLVTRWQGANGATCGAGRCSSMGNLPPTPFRTATQPPIMTRLWARSRFRFD